MKLPVIGAATTPAKRMKGKPAAIERPQGNRELAEVDHPDAKVLHLFPKSKAMAKAGSKPAISAPSEVNFNRSGSQVDQPLQRPDFFGSLLSSVEKKFIAKPEQTLSTETTNEFTTQGNSQQMDRSPLAEGATSISPRNQPDFSAATLLSFPKARAAVDAMLSLQQAPGPLAPNNLDPIASDSNTLASSNVVSSSGLQAAAVSKIAAVAARASVDSISPDGGSVQVLSLQMTVNPINSATAFERVDLGRDQEMSDSHDQHTASQPRAMTKTTEGQATLISATGLFPATAVTVPSPVAQIIENIRDALTISPPVRETSPGSAATPSTSMQVQLQPEGLGVVTITLKSTQGRLKVDIAAKLESTRQELERGAHDLVYGLRRTDAALQDVDLTFVSPSQDSGFGLRGQSFDSSSEKRPGSQTMSGFASDGGQDANRSGTQSSQGHSRLRPDKPISAAQSAVADLRPDGIYL
jgi:flagellar hook-length control protein FliK